VVAGWERAKIAMPRPDAGAAAGKWEVTVSPLTSSDVHVVHAKGTPKTFTGETEPLILSRTALSKELGVPPDGAVVAQDGTSLVVNVGALPGGTLTTTGRSGMRGDFQYHFRDHVGGLSGAIEGEIDVLDRDDVRAPRR
jgi:hypothetical protein